MIRDAIAIVSRVGASSCVTKFIIFSQIRFWSKYFVDHETILSFDLQDDLK